MQGRKQTDNRQQEVSEISRALKQLARELSCPVLALSQLSRAVEARQNKRPMLSDLRESGCLTGDTQILLPETGEYVRMDSLIGKTGFKVMALNTYTWKLEPSDRHQCIFDGRQADLQIDYWSQSPNSRDWKPQVPHYRWMEAA